MLIAIGIGWDGRRHILGVDLASRESRSSWKSFLTGLRKRGLHGVEFVASDNHDGLVKAIRKVLGDAIRQRCYAHFLRNALDYIPGKGATFGRVDDDCLRELR